METTTCDLCHMELLVDASDLENALVMQLAPGLIYYPEYLFGSYNGAEVHMTCAAEYQQYLLSEKLLSFDD